MHGKGQAQEAGPEVANGPGVAGRGGGHAEQGVATGTWVRAGHPLPRRAVPSQDEGLLSGTAAGEAAHREGITCGSRDHVGQETVGSGTVGALPRPDYAYIAQSQFRALWLVSEVRVQPKANTSCLVSSVAWLVTSARRIGGIRWTMTGCLVLTGGTVSYLPLIARIPGRLHGGSGARAWRTGLPCRRYRWTAGRRRSRSGRRTPPGSVLHA